MSRLDERLRARLEIHEHMPPGYVEAMSRRMVAKELEKRIPIGERVVVHITEETREEFSQQQYRPVQVKYIDVHLTAVHMQQITMPEFDEPEWKVPVPNPRPGPNILLRVAEWWHNHMQTRDR